MNRHVVQAVGLERRYSLASGEVGALRGVDITIDDGEFVALTGPSGSGKSTLLNLLGGLDRPTGGSIVVDGLDLGKAGDRELTHYRQKTVGIIFQSFNLLPRLTAVENVEMPLVWSGVSKKDRRARAIELLNEVGLGHRHDHKPSQLSGGEQQRVAVARSLVGNPKLILADEPTGNLDTVNGRAILRLLSLLNQEKGLTIALVTHDAEVAAAASRRIRLRDGVLDLEYSER